MPQNHPHHDLWVNGWRVQVKASSYYADYRMWFFKTRNDIDVDFYALVAFADFLLEDSIYILPAPIGRGTLNISVRQWLRGTYQFFYRNYNALAVLGRTTIPRKAVA